MAIRKKLDEAIEWLWDAGETAPTKDLRSAKSELECARPSTLPFAEMLIGGSCRQSASAITTRISEAAGRAAAATELRISMVTAQAFLITASNQLKNDTAAGEPSKYTETELKTLETAVSNNEKWLSDLMKKQDSLAKNEDPILRISELNRRKKELSTQLAVLQAKRPRRRTKKANESAGSSESSSTASTTTIPAESASGEATTGSSTAPSPTTTLPHQRDEL